jgi:hypothetical protein
LGRILVSLPHGRRRVIAAFAFTPPGLSLRRAKSGAAGMDDELRGVKGWLLTFVIIVAVISPVGSAIFVYNELYADPMVAYTTDPRLDSGRLFEWGLVAAQTLIGWFIAYRVFMVENWTTVRIAVAGVWIMGPVLAIIDIVGISMILNMSIGDVLAFSGPGELIRPFGFAIIWTSYLLKSERVANTYREAGGEQAEVFE